MNVSRMEQTGPHHWVGGGRPPPPSPLPGGSGGPVRPPLLLLEKLFKMLSARFGSGPPRVSGIPVPAIRWSDPLHPHPHPRWRTQENVPSAAPEIDKNWHLWKQVCFFRFCFPGPKNTFFQKKMGKFGAVCDGSAACAAPASKTTNPAGRFFCHPWVDKSLALLGSTPPPLSHHPGLPPHRRIIMNYEDCRKHNPEIMKKYGVPAAASPNLLPLLRLR